LITSHVLDDLPAYALDILEPNERERIQEHLRDCPSCQAEWRAYQETIAALPLTIPQVNPPERVKQAILSRVQPVPVRQNLLETIRHWFTGPFASLRIAGVALILILSLSNLYLWDQVNKLSQMQQHGYSYVSLDGTQNSPQSSGMVIYTRDGKYGLLVVNRLDQLPEDKQYQLWLVKNGQRTSGGVFSVYKSGYSVMQVHANSLLTSYESFGITIEPAGGSLAPTGSKVLGGKF
jgi:anti-sigma-K factor RskA